MGEILKKHLENTMKTVFWNTVNQMKKLIMTTQHARWLLWKIAPSGYLDPCWMNLSRLSKIGWIALTLQRRKKVRELPIECKYLTFNYTETLEVIYGIPASNILHIHGSRILNNEYIIGHNNFRNPDEAYNDESQMLYLQETWSKIIEWMNGLVKDSTFIIRQNKDFFSGLSDIEQIVVYGHSFYEVDWPYMKEIVKQVGADIPWSVSYYSPEDLERINDFVKKIGLTNVRTFNW